MLTYVQNKYMKEHFMAKICNVGEFMQSQKNKEIINLSKYKLA